MEKMLIRTIGKNAFTPKFEIKKFDRENSLKTLQENVGGYIERISYFEELDRKGIDAWINDEGKDEGKLENLQATLLVVYDGTLIDAICGNIVFTRVDEEGRATGLTDDDIDYLKREFGNPLYVIKNDER